MMHVSLQDRTLLALSRFDRPATVREITDKVNTFTDTVDTGAVNTCLDRLERAGDAIRSHNEKGATCFQYAYGEVKD